jgi:hypothetical protein
VSGPGTLIPSPRLGVNVWLIHDPAFKPDDGLAWYYEEELAMIDKMNDEELRKVQEVKLAFPGSHVRDFKLKEDKMDNVKRMPPLPYIVQYKREEVDELLKGWAKFYPKENPRRWTVEEAKKRGFKNNDIFCLVGEDATERFLRETSLKSMRTSDLKPGADKVDFIVEGWRIDSKNITTEGNHWRGNNFRLRVGDYQVLKVDSKITAYWFTIFNPVKLTCELYGWRPRKDYLLRDKGGLAIFRPSTEPITRDGRHFLNNQHDLGADEMFSEEEFFTRKGD